MSELDGTYVKTRLRNFSSALESVLFSRDVGKPACAQLI